MLINKYREFLAHHSYSTNLLQEQIITDISEYLAPRLKIPFIQRKPKGFYIYGDVGRGKSMIANLFFANVEHTMKAQYHCNELMKLINFHVANSAIDKFIKELYKLKFLYIDEFDVLDIGFASAIRNILIKIMHNGCFVILTSNKTPSHLYKDGLQRDKFVQLIDYIEDNCKIYNLDHDIDYRKIYNLSNEKYILCTDSYENGKIMHEYTNNLYEEKILKINDRDIKIFLHKGELILSFDIFCCGNYSHNDYREITKLHPNILIHSIPDQLCLDLNAWRRFIWLIDEIYENKCHCKIVSCLDIFAKNTELIKRMPEIARSISRIIELVSIKRS